MITIDTNVLVYAHDGRDPLRQAIALNVMEALGSRGHPIGLQAIGEFQNAARHKLKQPIWQAAVQARRIMQAFSHFASTSTAVAGALDDMEAGRLSYWDALLVRSAAEHGCTAMFSEDMQDGSRPDGVEIVNPFGESGVSDRARDLLRL